MVIAAEKLSPEVRSEESGVRIPAARTAERWRFRKNMRFGRSLRPSDSSVVDRVVSWCRRGEDRSLFILGIHLTQPTTTGGGLTMSRYV